MRQILLQNVTAILLQNATVLLQNTTVITKCDDFVTKYNSYYKMHHLLQNALIHTFNSSAIFLSDLSTIGQLSVDLFLMGTGQNKFSSWHPIGYVKTGMQNQSARPIDKQLETLLFVILYSLNMVRCAIR